jgi:hypothetical protein
MLFRCSIAPMIGFVRYKRDTYSRYLAVAQAFPAYCGTPPLRRWPSVCTRPLCDLSVLGFAKKGERGVDREILHNARSVYEKRGFSKGRRWGSDSASRTGLAPGRRGLDFRIALR